MPKLTDRDINSVIGIENAGYIIEKARVKGGEFIDSDHYGIVLAKNKADCYVTWQFHLKEGAPSFYWGHYHVHDVPSAINDYNERH